jgi:hypothetical protein
MAGTGEERQVLYCLKVTFTSIVPSISSADTLILKVHIFY